MQHWLLLLVGILFEVAGTTCMKLSDGFTRLVPAALMFLFYVISVSILAISIRKIEISVAYAVWAGLGTVMAVLIGIVYFKESAAPIKMVSILLVIVGIVGLNLSEVRH